MTPVDGVQTFVLLLESGSAISPNFVMPARLAMTLGASRDDISVGSQV